MSKKTIWLLVTIPFLFLVLGLAILAGQQGAQAADAADSYTYLPIVAKTKVYPVPQVAGSITLSGARCPNDIAYNEKYDLWYVLNTGSSDVSIAQNEQWAGNVWVGGRPTAVDVNQNTGYAYVTNLPEPAPPASVQPDTKSGLRPCGDPNGPGRDPACISVFNGGNRIAQRDPAYEPFAVKVHPVTGNAYVTDLDSRIYLFAADTITATIRLETDEDGPGGWALSLVHDPVTGLSYLPSWGNGVMYVTDGTTLTDSFSYAGWGGQDIDLDVKNGYFYVTNSQTQISGRPTNNISIFRRGSQTITQLSTATASNYVAVNQATGFVYITNSSDQTVTVLRNGAVVKTVSTQRNWSDPAKPWDVEVNQESGYAFVTLPNVNEVLVFKDADIVARLQTGQKPFAVGVDNVNGITYIINRTSRTAYDDLQRPYEECLANPTITILR
ncbi:MAG TPA: hypothetical protein ENK32_06825 [Anaerolineae bacterium]|nr:hypothetical protein [Anaerolineae bacterium]